MSNLLSSSLVQPSSSAAGLGVQTDHVCARHPEMHGERGCPSCSAALCTACARSANHRHCPACRTQSGLAPHVVDVGWRVHLHVDALVSSLRAVPQRLPVLAALLGLALFVPFVVYVSVSEGAGDDDGWLAAAALGGAFAFGAFALGGFVQPLLVLPQVAPVPKLRFMAGSLLAALAAFSPLGLVVAASVGVIAAGADGELVGNFVGVLGVGLAVVSFGIGLLWQGRAVLGRGPSLRGGGGTVLAHFCMAGVWSTVSMMMWLPAALAVGLGALVGVGVAGVCAVIGGIACWVVALVGSGSFAAAVARYSADLEDLT